MSTSAIVTMVLGVGVVWGALIASVLHAVRVHRATKAGPPRPDL